jgi:hypothetical protein
LLIAALLTIARLWNQYRCPSTNEWIKNMWYIYTMKIYSAIKRMKFCGLHQKKVIEGHHGK